MTVFLLIWFATAFLCTAWVAYDVASGQPEIMPVMKVAWVLITLYLGVAGLVLYLTSCREWKPGTHEQFVSPMWKQAVGSTMHCVAGDAVGIVLVAAITSTSDIPRLLHFPLEYAAAFIFGWLIFQVGPVMAMQGQSLRQALSTSFTAEFLSLTAMVLGMFPTIYLLRGTGEHVAAASSLRFWGAMSAGIAVGFLFTYPVNWWLVKTGRKHGMGSVSVMGAGGHGMPAMKGR